MLAKRQGVTAPAAAVSVEHGLVTDEQTDGHS